KHFFEAVEKRAKKKPSAEEADLPVPDERGLLQEHEAFDKMYVYAEECVSWEEDAAYFEEERVPPAHWLGRKSSGGER
ncbi:hypothetical protein BOX15_Mlig003749g7, partial [Macrostomum lignano]